jgi:hypothetical protein
MHLSSIFLYTSIVFTAVVNGNYQNAPSTVNDKVDYTEFKKSVNDNKSLLINHPTKEIRN